VTVLDFIVLTLAASAWVDTWFNGSIFDSWRAYSEAMADSGYLEKTRLRDLFYEMVTCKFCFSHHTPWILAVAFFLPALFVQPPWDFVLKIPVYSLAATRLGNIINAFTPDLANYYRSEVDFTDEDPDDGTTTTEPDAGDGA
jgi:hypothetical protein